MIICLKNAVDLKNRCFCCGWHAARGMQGPQAEGTDRSFKGLNPVVSAETGLSRKAWRLPGAILKTPLLTSTEAWEETEYRKPPR